MKKNHETDRAQINKFTPIADIVSLGEQTHGKKAMRCGEPRAWDKSVLYTTFLNA